MKTHHAIALCVLVSAFGTQASMSEDISVTRSTERTIQTPLGFGIVLNEKSSLDREWVTVHDPSIPADLVGTTGVDTAYESGRSRADFKCTSTFSVEAREALSAVEIRFLTFDVWGQHKRTLVVTEIADLAAGTHAFEAKWRLFSENEASEYYASIAYISRVRTSDGRVVEADAGKVIEEARKFSAKFTEEDLEPETEKK